MSIVFFSARKIGFHQLGIVSSSASINKSLIVLIAHNTKLQPPTAFSVHQARVLVAEAIKMTDCER